MIFIAIVAFLSPIAIGIVCKIISRSKRAHVDKPMKTHLVYFDGKAHHIRKGD